MFPAERTTLVLGGPGCGKTTRLLQIVDGEMRQGISPESISYVSFTKAAVEVAKSRAAAQFHLNPKQDLPWFRTIHSMAYGVLGLQRDEVMEKRDWAEFSSLVGEPITGRYEQDVPIPSGTRGDQMLRVCDLAAAMMRPLEDVWYELAPNFSLFELRRFANVLAQYKLDCGKMDYNDMLTNALAQPPRDDIRVAVIDEAQDLTPAQWHLVSRILGQAQRVYIGGDDDQAIYRWAGADVDVFLQMNGRHDVLPQSHRLPRAIHRFAGQLIRQIPHRFAKDYAPADRDGTVEYHANLASIDLGAGSWLLLARNGYLLSSLEALARSQGVHYRARNRTAVRPEHVRAIQLWERVRAARQPDLSAGEVRLLAKMLDQPEPLLRELERYTLVSLGWLRPEHQIPIWHEAFVGIPFDQREYYIACLRRGEKLTKEPRVRIDTIHAVKGDEADHVLMLTDVAYRTAQSFSHTPDHEHRVFYVGATRAKNALHVVYPQTPLYYPMRKDDEV